MKSIKKQTNKIHRILLTVAMKTRIESSCNFNKLGWRNWWTTVMAAQNQFNTFLKINYFSVEWIALISWRKWWERLCDSLPCTKAEQVLKNPISGGQLNMTWRAELMKHEFPKLLSPTEQCNECPISGKGEWEEEMSIESSSWLEIFFSQMGMDT